MAKRNRPTKTPKVQCSHCCDMFNPKSIKGAVHLASCKVYNGHKNYETWVVSQEGSCRHWREQAEECREKGKTGNFLSCITTAQRAVYLLAKQLKEEIGEQVNGDDVEGLAADLMGAALCEVSWDDIAQSMIDELPPEEKDDSDGEEATDE